MLAEDHMERSAAGVQESGVTQREGLAERGDRVRVSGDEFLGEVASITGLANRPDDRWIVDFLVKIQLSAARIAGGVIMPHKFVIAA